MFLHISFPCFLQAVPHLRRGTTDSINDETFGSTEYTSQDKAEEEKRRRGNTIFSIVYYHLFQLLSFCLFGCLCLLNLECKFLLRIL